MDKVLGYNWEEVWNGFAKWQRRNGRDCCVSITKAVAFSSSFRLHTLLHSEPFRVRKIGVKWLLFPTTLFTVKYYGPHYERGNQHYNNKDSIEVHTINKETDIKSIGDNIVGAYYISIHNIKHWRFYVVGYILFY